jgi:hypothetical protein
MTRARALVAAVPQRVWTAVAGLVLLASLGVTLVLAAGLATWQGAVNHTAPGRSAAQPPVIVVRPPGSSVIVVPTPVKQGEHPVASVGGPAVTPGSAVGVLQPLPVTLPVPPTPAPVATPLPPQPQPGQPVTQQLPPTANPRVVGSRSPGIPVNAQHGKAAKPAKATQGKKAAHGKKAGHVKGNHHKPKKPQPVNRGKHLGWAKNGHGG